MLSQLCILPGIGYICFNSEWVLVASWPYGTFIFWQTWMKIIVFVI